MSGPPDHADPIARQDEMLELLFWMEGEKISGAATLDGITRFLAQPREQAEATLRRLLARGDVELQAGEYRLTANGRAEAGRRFAESFAPLLSQGHGECNDPECECRDLGPAACRNR